MTTAMMSQSIFTRTTSGVKITAMPMYLPEQSAPDEAQYVWAYTIRIENQGDGPVQLIDRTWKITDATGQLQQVTGPGVVGEQPLLEPGMSFQYTSGTVLNTPSGIMEGLYGMERIEDGSRFEVQIPAFSLDSPDSTMRPN